jgi:D-alanyl-D-alanine carboxypeptidase
VATIVLQLSAEHKLALDDSVAKYLPGLVPNGNAITLRELLWHRSGLFEYFDDPGVVAPYVAGHLDHTWTAQQLVRMATKHKPLFAPGAPGQQSYNNTGYALLGLVIEKVTGNTFRTEVERRIIRPLGLKNTSFPGSSRMPAPYAHGYSKVFGGNLRDETGLSLSLASFAGGIVSTPQDVANFYRALLRGRLLPAHLVAEMKQRTVSVDGVPSSEILGPGLIREALSCSLVWGHNGDFPGYQTDAFGSGNGTRQIVVLVNSEADYSWTPAERAAVNHLMDVAYCG